MAIPFHLPYSQHQQPMLNQAQPVFDNNAGIMPMNMLQAPTLYHNSVSSLPTQPPAVVPQPQGVTVPTPLQDLLGNLNNLYEQPPPPGPSEQTAPDLHLLQPAEPHHGYSEQLHHQQSVHAEQEHLQEQVRADISESD